MELIDRARVDGEICVALNAGEITRDIYVALRERMDGIENADIASARHGTWEQDEWDEIEGTGVYKCSVCKEEFILIDGTPEENLYVFCPACGARMDGQDAAQ